jgi:cytochrome c oxidase cbb3-type subunit I/II
MVVWSQRSCIYFNHSNFGINVLFFAKAAERPVFSYKLSIIHFWSLIFVYIWAGHHLQYTAIPAWAQAVGTGFSIMLIAPSWGGMLNGIDTERILG